MLHFENKLTTRFGLNLAWFLIHAGVHYTINNVHCVFPSRQGKVLYGLCPVSCMWKRSSFAHLQHFLDIKREWVSVYVQGQEEVVLCPHQWRGNFCDLWHVLPPWHGEGDSHKVTFYKIWQQRLVQITEFLHNAELKSSRILTAEFMLIVICVHSIFLWRRLCWKVN